MRASAQNLSEGLNALRFRDGQHYYLYIPQDVLFSSKTTLLLVSVHGYSGRKGDAKGRARVRRYAEIWSDLAERNRWVVLSPQFDEKRFNNVEELKKQATIAEIPAGGPEIEPEDLKPAKPDAKKTKKAKKRKKRKKRKKAPAKKAGKHTGG